jgi:hypothetical protein
MPMLSAFRFLLTLVLISASLRAQASRPYCEVKVGKNVVKVFLEADETVGDGFKPGMAKNYLKLLGLPADIGVLSEAWICDKAATAKQASGVDLTKEEDANLVRFMIIASDSQLSESGLKTIKLSALDAGKDKVSFDAKIKATQDRLQKAGVDNSAYAPKSLEEARDAAVGMKVVSEGPRHCTLAMESPSVSCIVAYVLAESRLVMITGWFSPGGLAAAAKRTAEIVSLIEDQTPKWDGVVPPMANARFNGPDGLFSYKCADKWQPASTENTRGFFPPGTQYALLQYPVRTQIGVYPVITMIYEKADPAIKLSDYWEFSLKAMDADIKAGIITDVSTPRPYPTSSGLPAITTSFSRKDRVKNNCRLVIMMIGPGEFLATTIVADESARAEVIQSAWECVDSIDTPSSPKQRAIR